MNPCPCGWAGDPSGRCHCSSEHIARYRSKLSGPLLDRLHLHVEVPRPAHSALPPAAARRHATPQVPQLVIAPRPVPLAPPGTPNPALLHPAPEPHFPLLRLPPPLLPPPPYSLPLS